MTRRHGLLAELSEIQETYRGMLTDLRNKEDRSYREVMTASEGMDDEALISVACVLLEISNDHNAQYQDQLRDPEENDLLYAQEFIDHLDTLGKIILSK
jgi:hypothetical protein